MLIPPSKRCHCIRHWCPYTTADNNHRVSKLSPSLFYLTILGFPSRKLTTCFVSHPCSTSSYETMPQTLGPLDYGCADWRISSQRAADLYSSGTRLWTKEDLEDIEQQLRQSYAMARFSIRRIDGSVIQISNPMFQVQNPIWYVGMVF